MLPCPELRALEIGPGARLWQQQKHSIASMSTVHCFEADECCTDDKLWSTVSKYTYVAPLAEQKCHWTP